MDDVASTGTLCGGWRGEHRCTTRWMTWPAPVHYAVGDVASTCTRGPYQQDTNGYSLPELRFAPGTKKKSSPGRLRVLNASAPPTTLQ